MIISKDDYHDENAFVSLLLVLRYTNYSLLLLSAPSSSLFNPLHYFVLQTHSFSQLSAPPPPDLAINILIYIANDTLLSRPNLKALCLFPDNDSYNV
jgi:hypothetical protein